MSIGSYTQQKRDGGMLTIQPSAVHVQALKEFGELVPKAAAAAQRRAINKTIRWLRTHVARAVGKQERIAIGAVRQRLRAYPVTGGDMRGKLWFGINAIEASRTGRARQTGAGVSVAGRRYQGAFSRRSTAATPISGSARPANTSTPPTTQMPRRVADALVSSKKTTTASLWQKPRCHWSKCDRTLMPG